MKKFDGNMILHGKETIPEPMKRWRECPDEHLAQTFQTVPPDGKMWGYSGQIGRIGCIDFGTFQSELVTILNDQNTRVSFCHALVPRSTTNSFDKDIPIYTLLMEVEHGSAGNRVKSYYQAGSQGDTGLQLGPRRTINKVALRHYGINTEVREQFCHNWCYVPNDAVSSLFYSFGPNILKLAELFKENSSVISEVKNKTFVELATDSDFQQFLRKILEANNYVPVRGLKYPIIEDNLSALKSVINAGSHLLVHLGINPSDFTQNDDLFTIILEISDNSNKSSSQNFKLHESSEGEGGTTLLDFVQACPPWCPPPDGD